MIEIPTVTSPPTNQRRVTHPANLPVNFAYKNSSLKAIKHEPPVLLAQPCNKTFFALDSDVSICLASLCIGHMNLHLATLLGNVMDIQCCFQA